MFLDILLAAIVGLFAQLVDGALGMAYGVTSNSFLLFLGLTPAIASASVHTAELFTTAVSGVSHLKMGNVDKALVKKLAIPGCASAAVGAYFLVNISVDWLKTAVSIYLAIMGGVIVLRAFHRNVIMRKINERGLAAVGGFFDAIGGGGWGPIVTSTLVANGKEPRKAIGSVNLAEFFVTISQSAVFIMFLGVTHWPIILGLIIGGVIMAPFAAYVCKKAPTRILMALVGLLIIGLSIRTIYLSF